ncbi:DinB family protein [Flavobacterium agricola]|uniref:DinB family protein n=1 Tax=Flavobacterium agricola TaxID=2870839 RepID=A0ABY6LWS7_9FLAO|nr:DinB family protein [Flavobacterium agricola]UYW00787.1 DinB family protein [Flavobacterium agricola]
MSIKTALLMELEHEKNNTLRVLKNLKNDKFDFKPHEKSMALGQLANHVVELHNWIELALTTEVFDLHTDYKPYTFTTVEELEKALEAGYEKNKAIIEKLDEETYFTNWTMKAGDYVIATLPKAGALRFIITNHLIHHRGQLTVYMRLLDLPVPGIYGPSADEK